jgi:hypothetical protein
MVGVFSQFYTVKLINNGDLEYNNNSNEKIVKIDSLNKYDDFEYSTIKYRSFSRLFNNKIIEEKLEYVKTVPLRVFKNKKIVLFFTGNNYADFISRQIEKNKGILCVDLKVDFLQLINFLEKNYDWMPIEIKIKNYINEPMLMGDLIGKTKNKKILLNLVKNGDIQNIKFEILDKGFVKINNTSSIHTNFSQDNLNSFLLELMSIGVIK